MKRRIISLVVCIVLVLSTMIMPMNALASSGKYMKAKVNVHIHKTPGGDTIRTLKQGKKVWYTGKKDGPWYQVVTKDRTVGYVFKMYLANVSDKITRKTPSNVYVVSSKASLYKKNSTSSRRICGLKEGRYVEVLKQKDGWAYVRTANDRKGFIETKYLKKPNK